MYYNTEIYRYVYTVYNHHAYRCIHVCACKMLSHLAAESPEIVMAYGSNFLHSLRDGRLASDKPVSTI